MVLVTNEMCHEGFLITIDQTITLHTQECLAFHLHQTTIYTIWKKVVKRHSTLSYETNKPFLT